MKGQDEIKRKGMGNSIEDGRLQASIKSEEIGRASKKRIREKVF